MKSVDYPSLFKIELELTYRCPRKCIYCFQRGLLKALYGNNIIAEKKELKTREYFVLFKQAGRMGVEWINMGGGEPFLRKDILELIAYASGSGLKTGLPTKYSLSKSQMKALKDAGLTRIGISLDSHISDIANRMVGDKAHFYNSIQNIRLAKEVGLEVMLLPVITKLTIDGFPGLLRFARKLGVDIVRPQLYEHEPLMVKPYRIGYNKRYIKMLHINVEEYTKRIRRTRSSILEKDESVHFRIERGEGCPQQINYPTTCSIGKGQINIRPDGKVYICPRITDFVIGDIRKDSLRDIWYSGKIRDILFPERRLFKGTRCYNCEFLERCNKAGRCTYRCLKEYGRAFAPDPWLCRQLINK